MEQLFFRNNTAAARDGGAVYVRALAGPLRFRDCTFEGNKAQGMGGALGFGSTTDLLNSVQVDGCLFRDGSAGKGAAIGAEGNLNVVMSASKVSKNLATYGGAFYCKGCSRVYIGYPGG